jgi:hypothetical protein
LTSTLASVDMSCSSPSMDALNILDDAFLIIVRLKIMKLAILYGSLPLHEGLNAMSLQLNKLCWKQFPFIMACIYAWLSRTAHGRIMFVSGSPSVVDMK